MKYKIVSKTEGTLALMTRDNTCALFSRDESVVMDFLSESGAKGFMDIAHHLDKDFPSDCEIIPFESP